MNRLALDPRKVAEIVRALPVLPGTRRELLLGLAQLSIRRHITTNDEDADRAAMLEREEIARSLHELWKQQSDDLCLNVAWAQLAPHSVDPATAAPAFDRVIAQLESGVRVPLGGSAIYAMSERRRYVFERLAWEQVERSVPPDAILRRYLLEFMYTAKSVFLRRCAERSASTEALRCAVRAFPEGEEARPLLARDLREIGEFAEAIAVLEEHLRRRPLDLSSRVLLVELHLRHGAPEHATSVIDEIERIARVFADEEWLARVPRLRMGVPTPIARGAGA